MRYFMLFVVMVGLFMPRNGFTQTKENIQISGAFALYPMVVRWAEEFRRHNPHITIDISAGGAGKGITDVLAEIVDIGMLSRDLHDSEIDKGALAIAVAKDAVVATINSDNPLYDKILVKGIKRDAMCKALSATKRLSWGDIIGSGYDIPVHIYTRSDACGAAQTWGAFLGMAQEDMEGTALFGDPGVASVVQRDKVALGFNNIAYVYDTRTLRPHKGIAVAPIDLNGNGRLDDDERFYDTITDIMSAIAQERYPSPPSRNLYLVVKNNRQSLLLAQFLRFVLTHGQSMTTEAGYVALSPNSQRESLSVVMRIEQNKLAHESR